MECRFRAYYQNVYDDEVPVNPFKEHAQKTGHMIMKLECPDCGLSIQGPDFIKLITQYLDHANEYAHDSYVMPR